MQVSPAVTDLWCVECKRGVAEGCGGREQVDGIEAGVIGGGVGEAAVGWLLPAVAAEAAEQPAPGAHGDG